MMMKWIPLAMSVGQIAAVVLCVAAAAVIFLVIWMVSSYNKLVKLSSRVDNSWAQVDVQLKRRFDLIPNLVETVKGYASHEKALFEEITRLRGEAMNAGTPEEASRSNARLNQAMTNFFAVMENYPEVKASASFTSLQNQLSDLESKVAISRQFYNDTVMRYNEAIQRIPASFLAGMFHFGPRQYFQTYDNERMAPQVKF